MTRNTLASLLVPRADKAIIAGRLRAGALAGGIAQGHAHGAAVLEAELAGADLAGGLVEPIDPVEVGLRRGEKFVSRGLRRDVGREQGQNNPFQHGGFLPCRARKGESPRSIGEFNGKIGKTARLPTFAPYSWKNKGFQK